ncbi:ThiF family protein [Apiospora arundinis]
MTGPYLLGAQCLSNVWPLTAEKSMVALFCFRYWRFIVHCWAYHYLYKASPIKADKPTFEPSQAVTVVIPTVEPGHPTFRRCLASVCANHPSRIIIVTVGAALHQVAEDAVEPVRRDYFAAHPQGIDIQVHHTPLANKRAQIDAVIDRIKTPITFLVDSTAIWPAGFLHSALAPFEDPQVGLVGTRKRVERLAGAHASWWARCWNFLGAMYLERHNFEITASSALDGGVFIISGRTCGIRTRVLADEEFRRGYGDERISSPLFPCLPAIGPLIADDDNYILRWCVNHDIGVKFQSDVGTCAEVDDGGNGKNEALSSSSSSSSCVVGIANLGAYPRFLDQCLRWARTTFRSNPRSLLSARAWRRHPWSMYSVQLATITNFAVVIDGLLIHLYLQTSWYSNSSSSKLGLAGLVAWILLTKTVKLLPWLWRYPADMVFLPAYVAFAYYHSWIKLHAMLTFWNIEWAGRDLDKINRQAQRGEPK